MKILHLVTRRQLRGAEVFAAQLADGLVRRGCPSVVLGLYPPGDPPLEPSEAEAEDLGPEPSGGPLSWRLVRTLADRITEHRPDVVQANGSDTLKYSVLARRICRGPQPALVYRNISVASRWLRGPLHRAWNRWLVRRVDRVAAVSEDARRDFIATYGYPWERIVTLPIGVRIPGEPGREEARRILEELTGLPTEVPCVIHVGSFTPEKNHAGLLAAFREVHRSVPEARLVLVGDGPLRSETLAAAEGLRASGSVHWLGARRDAADLLAGAELLALPSRIEGLPGVVLEAAARAVPSVATRVGSLAEAVVHGETGLLVPPDDDEAFARALGALLNDPARRRRLGDAARSHVQEHYDLDRVVDAFLDFYRGLVEDDRTH